MLKKGYADLRRIAYYFSLQDSNVASDLRHLATDAKYGNNIPEAARYMNAIEATLRGTQYANLQATSVQLEEEYEFFQNNFWKTNYSTNWFIRAIDTLLRIFSPAF